MKDKKVVFMGTPVFAVEILKTLVKETDVVAVVTQPDKETGRKRVLTPSPVKKYAEEFGIDVLTPIKIRTDFESILKYEPDVIVTCAYGQIIPKELLDYPKYGCINVHASLLPKYRGGAPIQRAIMNGDSVTGITIMYMDEHMDSGDIITQQEVTIEDNDNIETLNKKLMECGSSLLMKTLPSIFEGTNERIKQNEEEVTFAPIIKREDEIIDFNRNARDIINQIRALYDNPCAYFILDGKIIKVYDATIGEQTNTPNIVTNVYKDGIGLGALDYEIIIKDIKPEGKNRIKVKDYLNGVDKDKLKEAKINA